jgi:hypothetical protein
VLVKQVSIDGLLGMPYLHTVIRSVAYATSQVHAFVLRCAYVAIMQRVAVVQLVRKLVAGVEYVDCSYQAASMGVCLPWLVLHAFSVRSQAAAAQEGLCIFLCVSA